MFFIVCAILMIFPEEAFWGALEGIDVAIGTVIPTILPFAVFFSGVVESGGAEKIGSALAPVFNAIGLSPYGATAFLAGLLGGYPTGAKTVCDMYEKALINKSEAENMLAYTNNAGVIFAINICGKKAFGSLEYGWIIVIVQVVAALWVGSVFFKEKSTFRVCPSGKKAPFVSTLGKCVATGGEIIASILSSFIVLYAVMGALKTDKIPFAAGLLEMTKGIFFAASVPSLPLAAMFLTFGGLGVFIQSGAICEKYSLSLKKCFFGKALAGVGAFVVASFLESVFKKDGTACMFFALCILFGMCLGAKRKQKNKGA